MKAELCVRIANIPKKKKWLKLGTLSEQSQTWKT